MPRAADPHRPRLHRRTPTLALGLALLVVAGPTAGPASATDGTLDTGFGASGIVRIDVDDPSTDTLRAVAIDDTGRIVAVGSSDTDAVVVRLLADGSLDPTFNTSGVVTIPNASANDVAITDTGHIVVVGTSGGDIGLVRLRSNGSSDTTFGGGDGITTTDVGTSSADEGLALALAADGDILVTGRSADDLVLLRYDASGSLDTTFGGGDGITLSAAGDLRRGGTGEAVGYAVTIDDEGRVLVGGTYGDVSGGGDGRATAVLARYAADGNTRDASGLFGGNGRPTAFRDLTVLSGGSILAVGDSTVDGTTSGLVVRYTGALLLDTTFGGGDGFNVFGASPLDQNFNGMAVQQDGRIVVAGATASTLLIDRLDALGTSDPTFGIEWLNSFLGGDSDRANDVTLQADGNVVVVGTQDGDLLITRVLGTPIVEETPSDDGGPSYDPSILDAPESGTARLTRSDGTFVLPGTSDGAGRVTYTHEELTATFVGTTATSAQRGLVGDGNGEVVVELAGDLTPDGVIEVWTASTPRLTAAHRISAGGADGEVQRFAVPLGAPLDGGGAIDGGAHVLQLVLPTTSGRQVLDVNLDVRDGASGPIPTAIPAGSGPTGPTSPAGAGLLTLALAGLVAARAGRGAFRRPRGLRAGVR